MTATTVEAPTATTAETVVTVPASDLLRVLNNAALFAGTDKTLPVLNAVRLESSDGILTAVATDRFVLGTDRCDLGETRADFATLVNLSDVKRITDTVKPWASRNYSAEVTLTVSESKLTFSVYDTALSVQPVQGEFPRYRSLIPEAERKTYICEPVGLNPAFVALFAKVKDEWNKPRKNLSVVLTFGESPTKVIRATVGSTFIGLIMPTRLSS